MAIRTLIIPSENRAREFDAKLLLGCIAVEAGFRVIVGSRHDIHNWINHLPRSIYLSKDIRASTEPIAKVLRYLGHIFVAWDEEALVYHSRDQYLSARVSPRLLSEARLLFAWGRDNAEMWRSHPDYDGTPILEVGNARLDLLRQDFRPFFRHSVERLRKNHGRYVLINSNFGSVNHILPNAVDMSLERIRSNAAREFQRDILQYRTRLFSHFIEAVAPISHALPEVPFVIRPHPSEDPRPWLDAARGLPNVRVCRDGNVIPWIMGSAALMHNGCTTALEARLLGQRVICYRPMESEKFDIDLPNRLGVSAIDISGVVALIEKATRSESAQELGESEADILSRYTNHQTDSLCCERIVAALATLGNTPQAPGFFSRQGLRGHFCALRRRRRKLRAAAIEGHKSSAAYNVSRFPTISAGEVIAGVAALGNCLNRFDGVAVKHLKENIFELHKSR